ncbi:MAG: tryptophan--tRNA ligase [Thermodesulfobacteriota bacterium]
MSDCKRIVSGMRPTGPLHLGHYFGVLQNWTQLQEAYDCYFFIADWHALTSEYNDPHHIKSFVPQLVMDWVAGGLDPAKCTLFLQSHIKAHSELHLLLSMITPLGWLERNPTYKEIKQELAAKDLNTYGFLGYPVLMSSDILMYRPELVPVGHDQLPHLELCREIARRFNYLYGDYFPEPEAKLTETAKLPGLDGRKMSKSYGNAIYLRESMEEIQPKIMSMLTDTARKRLKDPGDPKNCNLFPYLELLAPKEENAEISEGCTQATRGCMACKKSLLAHMDGFLTPIQQRRRELEKNPDEVWDIIHEGTRRAGEEAAKTLAAVHERLNMNY